MKQDLTFIAVVLDRSGSMSGVRADTIGGFNAFLEEQKRHPGEALFTLVQFDDKYEVNCDGVKIGDVQALTAETYVPRGSTALLDAIGRTIDSVGAKLSAMPEADRPGKVLVMIQTDGQENASREYDRARVAAMIKHQRDTYQWEFVFIGATEQSIQDAVSWGIQSTNTAKYAATSAGTASILRGASASLGNYRSGSKKLVTNFFDPNNGTPSST